MGALINKKFIKNKKPCKNYFKKKKVNNPNNRKLCIDNANGRCMDCNSMSEVSAHHIMFRSEVGIDDSPDNLIALCFSCHRKAHDGYYECGTYIPSKMYIVNLLERLNLPLYKNKLEERKIK